MWCGVVGGVGEFVGGLLFWNKKIWASPVHAWPGHLRPSHAGCVRPGHPPGTPAACCRGPRPLREARGSPGGVSMASALSESAVGFKSPLAMIERSSPRERSLRDARPPCPPCFWSPPPNPPPPGPPPPAPSPASSSPCPNYAASWPGRRWTHPLLLPFPTRPPIELACVLQPSSFSASVEPPGPPSPTHPQPQTHQAMDVDRTQLLEGYRAKVREHREIELRYVEWRE